MIPGIPYIYSLENIMIFSISNPFDFDFFLDISKLNGFVEYRICSIKS